MSITKGTLLIAASTFFYSVGALAQVGDYIDIRQYGASTDATDNRHSIQLALDEARHSYKTVLIPSGTFKVKGTLIIGSGVKIVGADRENSKLQQVGKFGIYSCQKEEPETPYVCTHDKNHPELKNNSKGLLYAEAPANSQLRNITIKNLTLEEHIPAGERRFYHEFQHLISLNGVQGVVIQDLNLIGARGDAIYIGAGIFGDYKNINNNDVLIQGNTIDGKDSDNRNGISVVHGSNIRIHDNTIRNTSRPNMPGAIDIEPDRPFHHVHDIHITENKIFGGKTKIAGLISIYLGDGNKETQGEFYVSGNKIDGELGAVAGIFIDVFPTLDRSKYKFHVDGNEIKNTGRGVVLVGLDNLNFTKNKVLTTLDDPIIGERDLKRAKLVGNETLYFDSSASRNLNFVDNTFHEVSAHVGNGIQVFNVHNMAWRKNRFQEFGTYKPPLHGYVFDFNSGSSSGVSFESNTFVNWWGRTYYIIQKESGHTFNQNTNKYCNNIVEPWNSQMSNAFLYNPALCN